MAENRTFREISRDNWTIGKTGATKEAIELGCKLRIADAQERIADSTEIIAKPNKKLIEDNKYLSDQVDEWIQHHDSMERSRNYYRGRYRKMKEQVKAQEGM